MRKLFYLVLIIAAVIGISKGIKWLKVEAYKPGPVTQLVSRPNWAKGVVTGADVQTIQTQLVAFITTNGRRPKSLQEMVDKRYLTEKNIEDPWGHLYHAKWTKNSLILTSDGADGVANTPDDIRHVINLGG